MLPWDFKDGMPYSIQYWKPPFGSIYFRLNPDAPPVNPIQLALKSTLVEDLGISEFALMLDEKGNAFSIGHGLSAKIKSALDVIQSMDSQIDILLNSTASVSRIADLLKAKNRQVHSKSFKTPTEYRNLEIKLAKEKQDQMYFIINLV